MCITREKMRGNKRAKLEGWLNSSRRNSVDAQSEVSLNFWCLNPAVAFNDLSDVTHSIILASGTLAPLNTFQSELGAEFPIRLEAPHVLDANRALICSIGSGPSGIALKATRDFSSGDQFLDEFGQLLFEICKVVPSGVLCFLSSYKMVDSMTRRWQFTGLYEKLQQIKKILLEPRNGEQMNAVMAEFYDAVSNPVQFGSECTGALLLAVCRGKVSEGLDFADDHARAVVTLGIPYPNFGDIQVRDFICLGWPA